MNKVNWVRDTIVIYLDTDGKYELTTFQDFCEMFAEETTTPNGVEPKLHIRDETEIWTWGYQGNNPIQIHNCKTPEEAAFKLCEMQLEEIDGIEHYVFSNYDDLLEMVSDLNRRNSRIKDRYIDFKKSYASKIQMLSTMEHDANTEEEKDRLAQKTANFRSFMHDIDNYFLDLF